MRIVSSLNTQGYINDPILGMSELLANYFSNKHSQSNLFDVKSIANDLAKHVEDPHGLAGSIRTSLEAVYSAYFSQVEIEANAVIETKPFRHYRIKVNVNCTSNGRTYNLAQGFEQHEGGFKRILEKR